MEYKILTQYLRVEQHLSKEGINSLVFDFHDEAAIESFILNSSQPVVIIIGGSLDLANRLEQRVTASGKHLRFYIDGRVDNNTEIAPLSSLIDTIDANKIEQVTKNFMLKAYAPQ